MYTYSTIQEVPLPELEMWSFIYESNPPRMTGSVSMSSEKQAHTHTQHYRINIGLIALTKRCRCFISKSRIFSLVVENWWTFRSFAVFWCGVSTLFPGWWKTRDLRLWNNQTWIEPPIVLWSSSCILDETRRVQGPDLPLAWLEDKKRGNVRYLDTGRMKFIRYT